MRPEKIQQKWYRRRGRQEYYYLCTFADGSTEELDTIPNDWLELVE